LVACSGGGGGQASAPTTTTTRSTTTQPTPTTVSEEDQVKQAYLAYWAMVDRLIAAPDAGDSELPSLAANPVLASLRDDLSTRQAQGRITRPPQNSKYQHRVQSTSVHGNEATVADCFIDDRVQYDSAGIVLNDRVST